MSIQLLWTMTLSFTRDNCQGRKDGVWCGIAACLSSSTITAVCSVLSAYSSLIWVIFTVISLIEHTATTEVMMCSVTQQLMSGNLIHWLSSLKIKAPGGTHPPTPRSLSKSSPMNRFVFSWNTNFFPGILLICTTGTSWLLPPETSMLAQEFGYKLRSTQNLSLG